MWSIRRRRTVQRSTWAGDLEAPQGAREGQGHALGHLHCVPCPRPLSGRRAATQGGVRGDQAGGGGALRHRAEPQPNRAGDQPGWETRPAWGRRRHGHAEGRRGLEGSHQGVSEREHARLGDRTCPETSLTSDPARGSTSALMAAGDPSVAIGCRRRRLPPSPARWLGLRRS